MTTEEIIEKYKDYLKKNDIKGFYGALSDNITISVQDVGRLTQYFYEVGADPLEYVDEIPENFLGCTDIKSFIIPNHIKKIGDFAFAGCNNLESIIIPEGVTEIDEWAFFHCISLKSIKLPDSLVEIRSNAFDGCYELTDINVPKNLKKVDRRAFEDCTEEIREKFKDFIK